MIVSVIDRSPTPTRQLLTEKLRGVFGLDNIRVFEYSEGSGPTEFAIEISPNDGPEFSVRKLRKTGSLSFDGTTGQNMHMAALVRSMMPAAYSRVVAIDIETDTYADLPFGVTIESLAFGWRDISEGDFG